MWQTRSGAGAMAVELAGALLTAVSDALGLAAVSFYLLVLAVPVTAIAGLVCFGRVVDAANGPGGDTLGRVQTVLATVLVLLIVAGAAVRGPAVPEGIVPPAATAALAAAFGVLVVQALVALVPVRRERA
jgi:hypothetical protein